MTKVDDDVSDYIHKMRDALGLDEAGAGPDDAQLAAIHTAAILLAVDVFLRAIQVLAGSTERAAMADAMIAVQGRHLAALLDRRGFPVIPGDE